MIYFQSKSIFTADRRRIGISQAGGGGLGGAGRAGDVFFLLGCGLEPIKGNFSCIYLPTRMFQLTIVIKIYQMSPSIRQLPVST